MKLKDVVTLGNLLGGFGAVVALLNHRFDWACYMIYIAYVFDVIDGPIARMMGKGDSFGAHLDTTCDYITNSVAGTFLVYYGFRHIAGWPLWAASVIGAMPIVFGTIRQAQGMDKPISYPCYWFGVPRPVSMLLIVSVLNSQFFNLPDEPWRSIAQYTAAGIIALLSVLHLSKIPFCNHKNRNWFGTMRFGGYWFLVGTPVFTLVAWLVWDRPGLVSDYMLFSLSMYTFLNWLLIPRVDFERMRHYLKTGEVIPPAVIAGGGFKSSTVLGHIFPFFGPKADGEATGESS